MALVEIMMTKMKHMTVKTDDDVFKKTSSPLSCCCCSVACLHVARSDDLISVCTVCCTYIHIVV